MADNNTNFYDSLVATAEGTHGAQGGQGTVVPVVPASDNNRIAEAGRVSPARHWGFTYNNYPGAEGASGAEGSSGDILELSDFVDAMMGAEIRRSMFQAERGEGENGTHHLQGYVEFKKKKRPFSVFAPETFAIHWFKVTNKKNFRKAPNQWIAYCSKEDTRVLPPWYHGILPKWAHKKLTLEQLYPWQRDIYNTLVGEPDDRKISWFWDSGGNVGKTVLVRFLKQWGGDQVMVINGGSKDIAYALLQRLGDGIQPTIFLMNVPRSKTAEYVSYQAIESLKDGVVFSTKYESGECVLEYKVHVVVMANEQPVRDKLSEDRWDVHEIITV